MRTAKARYPAILPPVRVAAEMEAALRAKAAARGVSLGEHLREIIAAGMAAQNGK